ncbi:MAG: thermonuclease family protein [Silicimonas sp.]|nr:thermonuclease family protein [Silicimonas sp.]
MAKAAVQQENITLQGKCFVVDGDTIVIDQTHVRIAGIDAPELDQPWGHKAKSTLIGLCRDQIVTAHVTGELSHNRVVAKCTLPDGSDLAAEIVRRGLALDWAAYSGGKYRRFETADARRKLWRSARRQAPVSKEVSGSSAA